MHGGDNPTAFNMNGDVTDPYCGRWFCNTHKCHETYGGDLIGFIKGAMEGSPFPKVLEVAEAFCDDDSVDFVSDVYNEVVLKTLPEKPKGLSKEEVRKRLIIPPQFYLDRKFSAQTLDKFDVGLCVTPGTLMYNRVVFPVYDPSGKVMIGSVGRTVVNDPQKWKNQKGFRKSEHLYNYHNALQRICQTGDIILVEGQGDVLRIWQSGFENVVGIFGSKLHDTQELLLQKTGAMRVITFFDNDEAGQKCREDCDQKLSGLFEVKHIIPDLKDAGEMEEDEVKRFLEKV